MYLDRHWHIQGDKEGCLYLWDLRKVTSSFLPLVSDRSSSQSLILQDTSCALADSWDSPAVPCALIDTLVSHTPKSCECFDDVVHCLPQYSESTPPTVTCAVYLASFGRLVCGQADGAIAVLSALQAATVLMLQSRRLPQGT